MNAISELWILPAPITLSGMSAAVGKPLDQLGNVTILTDESSIKLDAIRLLKQELSTHAAEEGRIIVLYPAEKLLLPAQQSLLKLLEEPPENTQILLFATSPQSLLPTIISRCAVHIATLNQDGQGSATTHRDTSQSIWSQLQHATTPKAKVMLMQSLPAKKAEFLELLAAELQYPPQSADLTNPEFSAFRTRALEVIEALNSNTTPALCATRFILSGTRS